MSRSSPGRITLLYRQNRRVHAEALLALYSVSRNNSRTQNWEKIPRRVVLVGIECTTFTIIASSDLTPTTFLGGPWSQEFIPPPPDACRGFHRAWGSAFPHLVDFYGVLLSAQSRSPRQKTQRNVHFTGNRTLDFCQLGCWNRQLNHWGAGNPKTTAEEAMPMNSYCTSAT